MRKIRRVMLLIVVFMIAVSIKGNTAFARYVIQVVPTKNDDKNSAVSTWTEINVSDAYDACQDLNTDASSLGHTENLKAHLTTNADWYAVSLLTYSAYGTRSASNTTGNKTGIKNFGTTFNFAAALGEGVAANANIQSLYDNIGTPYVESIKNSDHRAQNEPGRGLLVEEYVSSSFGSSNYGKDAGYPAVIRNSLFGFGVQDSSFNSWKGELRGLPKSNITFRPVIWNK